jgi:hypothetical protein
MNNEENIDGGTVNVEEVRNLYLDDQPINIALDTGESSLPAWTLYGLSGEVMVMIHGDGTVVLNPNYTMDDLTRNFWENITKLEPWTPEDITARNTLRSYFMDYPVDEYDEAVNARISQSPLKELVDNLIANCEKQKDEIIKLQDKLRPEVRPQPTTRVLQVVQEFEIGPLDEPVNEVLAHNLWDLHLDRMVQSRKDFGINCSVTFKLTEK